MIESYEIEQDVLILHLNFAYEFGRFGSSKKESIWKQVKDYITEQRIDFQGSKVVLMVGGIALATLFFPPTTQPELTSLQPPSIWNELKLPSYEWEPVEEVLSGTTEPSEEESPTSEPTAEEPPIIKEESEPSSKEPLVTVYRTSGAILTLTMEDYLVGVVAAEMPASFSTEALKAGVVVARTYALKKIERGERLTDSVATQAYLDDSGRYQLWGASQPTYEAKIRSAVKETEGEVLTYQGSLIDAVYHSTSNGRTEDAAQVWGNPVPYLVSVESPWDQAASSYLRVETKELNQVMQLLGVTLEDLEQLEILSRNSSGRVSEVRIGSTVYLGTALRTSLGLRSTDFDCSVEDGHLVITTRGYGHGVGMSQYGANGMANAGYSYEQILTHYYTGVQIEKR